jgi:hypothetical protein
MKKAKIMLVAIAALATVGGALAFKANNKFKNAYCTRAINQGSGACQGEISNSKFVESGSGVATFFYSTKFTDCGVQCTESTSFVAD